MEPAVISHISSVLENVEKIVTQQQQKLDEISKGIIDALGTCRGEVVAVIGQLGQIVTNVNEQVVQLTDIQKQNTILNGTKDKISKGENKIIDILSKILGHVEVIAKKDMPVTSDPQAGKSLIDKISADPDVKTLLGATMMSTELVKNLAEINGKEGKKALKGVATLRKIIFGDGKKEGIINILKDLKDYESDVATSENIKKQIETLTKVTTLVKDLAETSKLEKKARKGLKVLRNLIFGKSKFFGKGKTASLMDILKELKQSEDRNEISGSDSVKKQIETLVIIVSLVKELANITKLERKARKGIKVLDSVIFGKNNKKKSQRSLIGILQDLKLDGKNAADAKIISVQLKTLERIIHMVKDLAVIAFIGKLARVGVKSLDKIIFGYGKSTGLMKILQKLSRNEKSILLGLVSVKHIVKAAKQLAILALYMTAMVVLAIPATLGAVMTAGFIYVFLKLNKKLLRNQKTIDRATLVMQKMMLGLIFMGTAMILMFHAVKDVSWEEFGMFAATVSLLAIVTIMIGKFAKGIDKGAIGMIIMGGAYIVMGIAMMIMYKSVKDVTFVEILMAIGTIAVMGVICRILGDPNVAAYAEAGALIMIQMALAFAVVGVGFWLLFKSIKGVEWEDIGKLCVGIIGLSYSISAAVVAAPFVAIVGVALIVLGLSLMVFAAGARLYDEWVTDKTIDKISKGIPRIINTFTDLFGDSSGNATFGSNLMSIITTMLKLGGAIFAAATLIIIGISLGILALCLKPWENFNLKAIDKFEYAYKKIEKIFHLDEGNSGAGLKDIGEGIVGLALAALKFGKVFFQMGTIMIVVFSMSLMYKSLSKWKDFDMGNIDKFEEVYDKIKTIFKLEDPSGASLSNIGEGIIGLATAVLQFGQTLFQMGTILLCVMTMDFVHSHLQKWSDFDMNSVKNFEDVYNSMKRIFKLENEGSKIEGLAGDIFGFASAILKFGKTLFQMGTIMLCVITMDFIHEHLQKWSDFDKNAISNFDYAYRGINRIFNLDKDGDSGFTGMFSNLFGMASAALEFGKMLFKMGTISLCVLTMGEIYENLSPWSKFDRNSIKNFEFAYDAINRIFKLDDSADGGGFKGAFDNIMGLASAALQFGKMLFRMGTIALCVITMSEVYNNLKKWSKFDKACIENFDYAYTELSRIFKFDSDEGGITSVLGAGADLAAAMLGLGKTFFQMGTVLLAVITMDKVYDYLQKWNDFDDTCITNFETAYTAMRRIFKFDEEEKQEGGLLGKLFGGIGEVGSAMLNMGKTMYEMGTVLIAVYTMSLVKEHLDVWNDFDKKCIDNFDYAYNQMRRIFKFDEESKQEKGLLGRLFGGAAEVGSAMLEMGKTFYEMGTILIATYTMNIVREHLSKWDGFNTKCINTFDISLTMLKKAMEKIGDVDLYDARMNINQLNKMVNTHMRTVIMVAKNEENIKKFDVLMDVIVKSLRKWEGVNYESTADSISSSLKRLFNVVENPGRKYTKNVNTSIKLFKTLKSLQNIEQDKIVDPFKNVVDEVNRVELDKAEALTDMFKSFASLKEKSIFSSFDDTVKKFTEACIKLVDAINGNTDALNGEGDGGDNSDNTGNNTSYTDTSSSNNQKKGTSVRISNIDELAQAIARRVGGGSGSSHNGYSQVEIRLDGKSGQRFDVNVVG